MALSVTSQQLTHLLLTYQQQVTVGATGIDLVVALYDGALRFLYRAKQSVLDDDVLEPDARVAGPEAEPDSGSAGCWCTR